MSGVKAMRLPEVKTKDELVDLVMEIGFLPYLNMSGDMHGFSVTDITSHSPWWSGDLDRDPWEWRRQIANKHTLIYSRLFSDGTGFVSPEWFPYFANYRRRGYDFDSLCDEGLAPYKERVIMDVFRLSGADEFSSIDLKRAAGFSKKGGLRGFEGVMTSLQMDTYLIMSGFRRRVSKAGSEYGWAISYYSPPESVFGYERVRSSYCEDPETSYGRLFDRARTIADALSSEEIHALLR